MWRWPFTSPGLVSTVQAAAQLSNTILGLAWLPSKLDLPGAEYIRDTTLVLWLHVRQDTLTPVLFYRAALGLFRLGHFWEARLAHSSIHYIYIGLSGAFCWDPSFKNL